MDNLSKECRHKNMSHIRSTNTKPERTLRHELWTLGIFYLKNVKSIAGKPDIYIPRYKICIFIDGEFWHGKQYNELQKNTTMNNHSYWVNKIKANMARDQYINEKLTADGYLVLRFWANDITHSLPSCLKKLFNYIPFEIVQKSKRYQKYHNITNPK